jgi:uncharacterized membrane protein HdeD (DUF308 family)
MFIGILLLLMGVLMLMNRFNLLQGNWWSYFWPVAIIALGISLIFKHNRRPSSK